MSLRIYEIVAGLLLSAGCIAFLVYVVPDQTSSGAGFALPPSLVPNVALSIILALSVLLIITRLLGANAGEDAPMSRTHWGAVLLFIFFFVLGFLLFNHVGYLAGGAALVLLFQLYMGEKRPLVVVGTMIGGPVVLYGVFWQLLSIKLP